MEDEEGFDRAPRNDGVLCASSAGGVASDHYSRADGRLDRLSVRTYSSYSRPVA
jgi:hypothetical protein